MVWETPTWAAISLMVGLALTKSSPFYQLPEKTDDDSVGTFFLYYRKNICVSMEKLSVFWPRKCQGPNGERSEILFCALFTKTSGRSGKGEGQGGPNGMPCPSPLCACRGQICTSASRNLSHMRTNRSVSSGPIVSMTAWARASGRWWTARKSGNRCVTKRRDRARPFRSFTT